MRQKGKIFRVEHKKLLIKYLPSTLIRMKYSLCLHKLLTLEVLVSFVSTANSSTVNTPALLRAITLLGLEFAVVLTLGVIDAIVVHKGGLYWLSSYCTGVQALTGSVHLSLHQETLRDH